MHLAHPSRVIPLLPGVLPGLAALCFALVSPPPAAAQAIPLPASLIVPMKDAGAPNTQTAETRLSDARVPEIRMSDAVPADASAISAAPAELPRPENKPPEAQTPAALTQPAAAGVPIASLPGETTENDLKQLLVGKPLFLRGGYLDDSLSFNEHGGLIGHSPKGSYTLCAIQIDRVRMTKHKVELEGARYGLHFLGALPYEDPNKAVDRVRITPKKKSLKITIDREVVVKPKKEKAACKTCKTAKPAPLTASNTAPTGPIPVLATPAPQAAARVQADAPVQAAAAPVDPPELSEADQLKADIAAATEAERPADPSSVTSTTSPAHAARLLKEALDQVFAQGLDQSMIDAMPEFWKLYYQAVAAKADFQPADPAVRHQNSVDQKARLLTTFEPGSNQYAQANGVAGMALYHAVIGPDGKPAEIAVARPIGFGLDESAVEAIRMAKFDPAIKDGKPAPVLLDLVVQFRIYSKRTAEAEKSEPAEKPATPKLPGPYSVLHPQAGL